MTGQQYGAVELMSRWELRREDLNTTADVLGVDRLSDEEWLSASALYEQHSGAARASPAPLCEVPRTFETHPSSGP